MNASGLRRVAAAATFGLGVVAAPVAARAACDGPAGWAALELDPALPPTIDVARLVPLLRGRLASARLGLCHAEAPPPGVPATAVFRVRPEGRSAVVIQVTGGGNDAQTTAGTVDLQALPPDGHTLAVATIAHELLRAAQVRRPDDRAPSNAAAASGAAPAPPAGRPRPAIAVAVAASQFQGGLAHLGPELQAGTGLLRWLEARVRLGYRWGGQTRAPHGSVTPQALLGGVGLRERLPSPWIRTTLGLQQQLDVARVRFSAVASPGHVAAPTSLNAVVVSAGPVVSVHLAGRLSLTLTASACFALVGARARDDGQGVVALDGLGGELAAGLAVEL